MDGFSGRIGYVVDRRGNLVFNSFTGKPREAIDFIKKYVSGVEPYISTNYSANGTVTMLQRATKGCGIDVVLMGDAFSDRQVKDGSYEAVMRKVMEYFFAEEPFTTLRDCFNVYAVTAGSKNEGYFPGSQSAIGGYFGTCCAEQLIACRQLMRSVRGERRLFSAVFYRKISNIVYFFVILRHERKKNKSQTIWEEHLSTVKPGK